MQAFDEVTKSWKSLDSVFRIVLDNNCNGVIYGYTSKSKDLVRIFVVDKYHHRRDLFTDPKLYKGKLLFSKLKGVYFSPTNMSDPEIFTQVELKGQFDFPYILSKKYEAVENFYAFDGKQKLLDESDCKLGKYLKYSFGLEFETAAGYVPEDICYRDGLIPLRDGSISAPEYSTVVLHGEGGLALLHQQINTLKEYTIFDKECSLHVHLGGYKLKPDTIYHLYYVCKQLEEELKSIVPVYTFTSAQYKDNGKDYCKLLSYYESFNEMYKHLVGRSFMGSFTQPHPNDIERKRKWNISTRYFWCNFINALCYRVNKTIEFRFLRPTYEYKKIILWLYIFNGILDYSEHYYKPDCHIDLENIMFTVYPAEIACEIMTGIEKLKTISGLQYQVKDFYGGRVDLEMGYYDSLDI